MSLEGLGLQFRGVRKEFLSGTERIVALDDLNLSVEPSSFVVIVGANGSGKSTLLNVVAGDVSPDRGEILWTSGDASGAWSSMPSRARAMRCARVFQDPQVGTVSDLTVEAHLRLVLCGPVPSPFRFRLDSQARMRAERLLEPIGLQHRQGALVSQLSAGQRQMFALVLAILRQPSILLLDEHTASLDPANAIRCMELTQELCRGNNITTLMVTHRLNDAVKYGDRLLVMRVGTIAATYEGPERSRLDASALAGVIETRSAVLGC